MPNSSLIAKKYAKKRIAELVNTSISTIYRELERNSRKRSYDAKYTQELCDLRKERYGRFTLQHGEINTSV